MGATTTRSTAKTRLLGELKVLYPHINFSEGEMFSYSADTNTVFYPLSRKISDQFIYSFLHEIGHAECLHNIFKNDMDLVRIEREAWEQSKIIGQKIGVTIDPEHIEQCMDTYRDWLYARSLCPNCHQCGLQSAVDTYSCPFCRNTWKVSLSRLCKVTRRQSDKK